MSSSSMLCRHLSLRACSSTEAIGDNEILFAGSLLPRDCSFQLELSLSLYANRKMEVRRTRSPASVCLNMLVSYVKWQSGRRRRRRQLGTAASTSSSCSAETSSFAADGRYTQKDKKRIYCIASAVRCAYVL